MKTTYKETDLYNPIRDMLQDQGFTVRGEVKGCDIAAVKDDQLWIVEMKLSANLKLIFQAMERQTATDWVFVAVPRPRKARGGSFMKLQRLLKKLQIGLISVALDSPAKHAEIILFPSGKADKTTKKSAIIRKEIAGRTTDTTGGSKGTVNTAYRERAVRIACLLEAHGDLSAKELTQIHGCEKDTYSILRVNYYNWYKQVARGRFGLSTDGHAFLRENEAEKLVIFYRMKAEGV
ncbi:MAG: DUF2161 family putative PD-(D/E)XK-type phosphodiesterase [Defluviitaleaceae bacterium]|nr:DUF2161 family putative PD-(D/E)XK-type phosphodiesterase [Defluviitaleaceae bacterium]